MITLLLDLVEIFQNIPLYLEYAFVSLINLVILAIEGWIDLAILGLPGLPPNGAPELISEINWFFPVGSVIAILAPFTTAYIAWLAVKWIFKKFGEE